MPGEHLSVANRGGRCSRRWWMKPVCRISSPSTRRARGAWHTGEPADRRMRMAATKRGYALTSTARQVARTDFDRFDHVIAMDRDNERSLRAICPKEHQEKISILRRGEEDPDVPDPYYGGPDGFVEVIGHRRALLPETAPETVVKNTFARALTKALGKDVSCHQAERHRWRLHQQRGADRDQRRSVLCQVEHGAFAGFFVVVRKGGRSAWRRFARLEPPSSSRRSSPSATPT